jgi:hypothetical protein
MRLGSRTQRPRRPLSERQAPSKKVFSYHGQRSESLSNTGRFMSADDSRKRTLAWARLATGISVAIILCLLGYLLWLGGEPQISLSQSSNVGYRSLDNYKSGIKHIWSDSPMNQTKLTASTSRLKARILQAYPELEEVEIHVPLMGTSPVITLKPATSRLMIINNQGALLLVDINGKALIDLQNAEFTGNNETIPNIIDETGLELKPGAYALTSDQVAFLVHLHKGLVKAKLPIKEIVLPAIPNQVNVGLQNKSYILKFNLSGDAVTGVGAYLAFIKELRQTGAPQPTKYVDLRAPEKVFYR